MIEHFTLERLLPPGQLVALNQDTGVLSLLAMVDGLPRILAEAPFTRSELTLLTALLRAWPYYAPNEVLYASFTFTQVNEKRIEQARHLLQEAQAEGTWDVRMRPLRNIMSRVRLKLQGAMKLTILTIFETGAILALYTKRGEP